MTTGTITFYLKNFYEDMPSMVERLISTAREKKMEEFEQFAARQASLAQKSDPDNASSYTRSNCYGYSREQWDAAVETINGMYSEFEDWFMAFGSPNPDDFTELIDTMAAAEENLGSALGIKSAATLAETDLGANWAGAFSNNLRSNFLAPLSAGITDNQAVLALVLRNALEANQTIYRAAQNDVFNIAQDAIGALGVIGAGDNGKTALAILAAVIPLGGAILMPITAGGSAIAAGVALAAVQAGIAAADEKIPEKAAISTYELGAPTVDEVMANVVGALNKEWADIETKEDEIVNSLKDMYDATIKARQVDNAFLDYRFIVPMAPAVNSSDPTAGFKAN